MSIEFIGYIQILSSQSKSAYSSIPSFRDYLECCGYSQQEYCSEQFDCVNILYMKWNLIGKILIVAGFIQVVMLNSAVYLASKGFRMIRLESELKDETKSFI